VNPFYSSTLHIQRLMVSSTLTQRGNLHLEHSTSFSCTRQDQNFIDKQIDSLWNFEEKAISGQMKGKQLARLPFDEGFWFECVAFILRQNYIKRVLV
jgi:Protein of unknown function (DUF3179)